MDLSQLIDIYRGPLLGLIASWGVPWVDAMEIAQDSFAEAYLNRESCRGDWEQPEVFGRWFRGVARNQREAPTRGPSTRDPLAKRRGPHASDRREGGCESDPAFRTSPHTLAASSSVLATGVRGKPTRLRA